MSRYTVKILAGDRYINRYPVRDEQNLTPYARVLAYFMTAYGVEKLFSYADLHDFLVRLVFFPGEPEIIDNYFSNNFLFTFIHEKQEYTITVDDLVAHIGLHIAFQPRETIPFDAWIMKRRQYYFLAKLSIMGNNLIARKSKSSFLNLTNIHRVTDLAAFHNAHIFANSVMKEVPFEAFKELEKKHGKEIYDIFLSQFEKQNQ